MIVRVQVNKTTLEIEDKKEMSTEEIKETLEFMVQQMIRIRETHKDGEQDNGY